MVHISEHIALSNVSACYELCDAAVSNDTVKANDIMREIYFEKKSGHIKLDCLSCYELHHDQ